MPRRRRAPGGMRLGSQRARGRPALVAALLALATIGIAPSAAGAAEDAEAVSLPGEAYAAVVTDLDGDGASDLVRIRPEGRTRHVVEGWSMGANEPALLGSRVVPMVSPTDNDARRAGSDASGLVLWHLAGRVRVLAIATWAELAGSSGDGACCLAFFDVGVNADGLTLEERQVDAGRADAIQAADLDGDGTDELVRSFADGEQGTQIEILRWDGAAFRSIFVETGSRAEGPFMVGDSDGVAGQDLLLGPSAGGEVIRVGWAGGVPRREIASVPVGEGFDGWITGVVDGGLVMSSSSGIQVIRWARAEQPRSVARTAGAMFVTGIAAGPEGALIAVQGASPGPFGVSDTLTLYDADLQPLGDVRASPTANALGDLLARRSIANREWLRYPWPYAGPYLPADATLDDPLVWNGVLITPTGPDDYATSPIALMPNLQPIGRLGADGGWIALMTGYASGATIAYLFPAVFPPGYGAITLAPFDDVVGVEAPAAPSLIEPRDAVLVSEPGADNAELMAPGDGFDAVVTAPPGSWLTTWDGRQLTEEPMAGETATVRIAPRHNASPNENLPIEAAVVVTTLDGHLTLATWSGTYVREAPSLRVEAQTDTLSFAARLEGDVDGPGTSIEIDGQRVATNSDGQFALSIGAVPWPHDIVVTVRDAVGNVTTERLQVIGFADYRGLPWAAMAVIATIGAGVLLFARIPRGGSRAAAGGRDRDDDARLEELELDDIEAIAEQARGGR